MTQVNLISRPDLLCPSFVEVENFGSASRGGPRLNSKKALVQKSQICLLTSFGEVNTKRHSLSFSMYLDEHFVIYIYGRERSGVCWLHFLHCIWINCADVLEQPILFQFKLLFTSSQCVAKRFDLGGK